MADDDGPGGLSTDPSGELQRLAERIIGTVEKLDPTPEGFKALVVLETDEHVALAEFNIEHPTDGLALLLLVSQLLAKKVGVGMTMIGVEHVTEGE